MMFCDIMLLYSIVRIFGFLMILSAFLRPFYARPDASVICGGIICLGPAAANIRAFYALMAFAVRRRRFATAVPLRTLCVCR